ncbi:alpha/beta hydrolase [Muriicola sp. Z0-33]|uniref:alpha/beta hydrolase n=1 Tax=Muriicola sp. Z0-33 TaxID=2816957 RepID=UPI002237C4D2|nr:alpha/beta fold hydrolase [Muriicola sp. Z0-33]MCW5516652.1 alpha/beta fold hydrolase [Muriicola sp. Z0-33]
MNTVLLSLFHLLRPSSMKEGKPPVIFLFHGYGSNEEDLFSFANELPQELCVISVRAPYTLEMFGNAWYALNFDASFGKWSDNEQAISSRNKVLHFIDEACEAYQLDEERISLLGFSQGTVLSYAIALSYPDKIKNVVALSGYIDKNILVENYHEKDHENLKVYASHGQLDAVIPPWLAQQGLPVLEELNIDHVYEEYPVGHGVSPQNFQSLRRWLEDKI